MAKKTPAPLTSIDSIYRAAMDMGSSLNKDPETMELRKQVSDIQIRAAKTPATDTQAITEMSDALLALDVPDSAKRPEYVAKK